MFLSFFYWSSGSLQTLTSAEHATMRADQKSFYSSAWPEKQPLISESLLASCLIPALPHSQQQLLAAARLDLSTCRGNRGRFHRGKQEIKFSVLYKKVLKLQYLGYGFWLRSFTLASDDAAMGKMKLSGFGVGFGFFPCHKRQFAGEEKRQIEGVPSCVTPLPCTGSQLGCA